MPKGHPGTKAPHGTKARYQGHCCRCEECRNAWRQFARSYYGHQPRNEWLASLPRVQHGTESRYTRYKCRCELCRTAANEARQRRRQANQDRENQYSRDYKWLTRYG